MPPTRLVLFKATSGLNNRVDATRLRADLENGLTALAAAYNVDIDDSGRLTRRKGYTRIFDGSVHSIFGTDDICLFVSESSLYRLFPSYDTEELRTGLKVGARMSYVRAGNDIYYSNGSENGIVRNGVAVDWVGEDYVGPTTTKTFSDPPAGHLLEVYNGRMYIAEGEVIWYSEPFAYSWFNLASNWIPFASEIQMMRAVDGGLYVSDEAKTYFLAGEDAPQLGITTIAEYPAIRGTDVIVEGGLTGQEETQAKRFILWTSPRGICIGIANGGFKNLTERNLVIPSARFGGGLYSDGHYITTLEP